MKRILLISLSVFGMTNFANAWTRSTPRIQHINGYHLSYTCQNMGTETCMYGEGTSPQIGQRAWVYCGGDVIFVGVVVRCRETPSENEGGQFGEIIEAYIETAMSDLPN